MSFGLFCPRQENDVAILSGTTPFVITCQDSLSYKRWENSLRHAVQEYKTWTSFRRGENVMQYFRTHVGENVRFLKGVEGARNDLEACWEEMKEVEIMTHSKKVFQDIEKASRKVENWHGVADQKITRYKEDVAFLPSSNLSRLAKECRGSKPFHLWEEAIKKAVLKYKRCWETFRRSGGINCYFWNELGDRRMLRARNEFATSDKDADWEVLCGEPLTAFMEKQFVFYACVLEDPEEPLVSPVEGEKAKATEPIQPLEAPSMEFLQPVAPKASKKRKGQLESQLKDPPKSKKRSKIIPTEMLHDGPDTEMVEVGPQQGPMAPPPNRKLVCSVFLLSKSLALPLGRIDAKFKTKWRLDRVRELVDPVLRKKSFLTQNAPWEFYFPNSGSFVSQAYEDHLRIDDYLAEAGEENVISIRVVV